jgi:hypothetical protein
LKIWSQSAKIYTNCRYFGTISVTQILATKMQKKRVSKSMEISRQLPCKTFVSHLPSEKKLAQAHNRPTIDNWFIGKFSRWRHRVVWSTEFTESSRMNWKPQIWESNNLIKTVCKVYREQFDDQAQTYKVVSREMQRNVVWGQKTTATIHTKKFKRPPKCLQKASFLTIRIGDCKGLCDQCRIASMASPLLLGTDTDLDRASQFCG